LVKPWYRRFLEEDQSSSTVGFRCAMTPLVLLKGNGAKQVTSSLSADKKDKEKVNTKQRAIVLQHPSGGFDIKGTKRCGDGSN
jgi:hypothetical protein